jgi:hypothetical protein
LPKDSSTIWSPVLEIGWDAKSGEITDAARWRAVMFDTLARKGAGMSFY